MTALNNDCQFLVNSSTGSDTAASGLGPATAKYGSTAAISAGSAVVNSIDTTGLSVGDVIWVDTTSGRQFNVIASVDNATQVTCDYYWDASEYIANWAVGGKRATLTGMESLLSYQVATDSDTSEIVLESDQTVNWTQHAAQNLRIVSSEVGTQRTVTQQSTYFLIGADDCYLRDLVVKTDGTGTKYVTKHDLTYGDSNIVAENCVFGATGASYTYFNDGNILYAKYLYLQATNCAFISSGFGTRISLQCDACYFDSSAMPYDDSAQWETVFTNCIFDSVSSIWVDTVATVNTAANRVFIGCIFNRCGSVFGRMFPSLSEAEPFGAMDSCVFVSSWLQSTANTPYGGSGNYAYSTTLPTHWKDSSTLSTDPLIDSANGDCNINDSTSGNTLRGVNVSLPNSTTAYRFRNIVTDDFGGGSIILIED